MVMFIPILSAALMSMPSTVATPTESAPLAERIDDVVRDYNARGEFDGAVLVIKNGKTVYANGVGTADRTWDVPNTADTRFHICSVTKQFTAMLIMQLVAEDRLDVDDSIHDHLPWYRADTGTKIRIRHLLTHRSGLQEPMTTFDELDDALALCSDIPAAIQAYCMSDLLFEPDAQFNYCNTDYFVLGAIIEALTGQDFADALQERILDPLEMHDTGMRRYESVVPRMATGYVQVGDTFEHRLHFGQLGYAAAGMYSTVEDMARWNMAVMNHTLLSEELSNVMFTPKQIDDKPGHYVGFGSWIYPRPLPPDNEFRPRLIERRGYITPFTALNVICPDDGHAIVLLSNTDPCDIHQLPYNQGLPLDLLLLVYDRAPLGPPARSSAP
ncbi:MAG: serine hydrolase domain-containing protein [Planctomycetota bacterium]